MVDICQILFSSNLFGLFSGRGRRLSVSASLHLSLLSLVNLPLSFHIVLLNSLFLILSQEASRREALKSAGVAFGAAFVPMAANAAAGESPRFSVFGLVGDGTSMSEGAAFGTDQSTPLYSPYSVYGDEGPDSLYKKDSPEYAARKKAVLAETKKRLERLPSYVDKKKWYEVSNELSRFMYETRGAAKFLASTPEQKKAATQFFKAMEVTDLAARRKNQAACAAGAADSVAKLDAFVKTL